VGFVVDKVALGQVSSEYFGFPCQPFHRLLHTHPSFGAGAIGQIVTDVPSKLDSSPRTRMGVLTGYRKERQMKMETLLNTKVATISGVYSTLLRKLHF
jgi:hypothetical protein